MKVNLIFVESGLRRFGKIILIDLRGRVLHQSLSEWWKMHEHRERFHLRVQRRI